MWTLGFRMDTLQVSLNWVVEPLFELRWVPLQSLGALWGKTGDLPGRAEGLTGEEDPPSWEVLLPTVPALTDLGSNPSFTADKLWGCGQVTASCILFNHQVSLYCTSWVRDTVMPALQHLRRGKLCPHRAYNMGGRYETSNQVNTRWITEGDKKLRKENTKNASVSMSVKWDTNSANFMGLSCWVCKIFHVRCLVLSWGQSECW